MEEEDISLIELSDVMQKTQFELEHAEKNLFEMLKELKGTTETTDKEFQHFVQSFILGGEKNE